MIEIKSFSMYITIMETFSYITVLSNWLLGYDRYQGNYSKELLTKSTFKSQFFLLKPHQEDIGLEKASQLLEKVNIPKNVLIKIETLLENFQITENPTTGRGWIYPQNYIPVNKVYLRENHEWTEISVEEITALAYQIEDASLKPYSQLSPRTLSLLPIAQACEARCWFCFSESSISKTQEKFKFNYESVKLREICISAKNSGAERFVITGGGEPGLVQFDKLNEIIKVAKESFEKIVLISNGLFLSRVPEEQILEKVQRLIDSGLTVLSISRHSDSLEKNKEIMGIDTKTEKIFSVIKNHNLNITRRLICVLQKMGVHDNQSISQYLDYAASLGVEQVCFKELYVASSLESLYSKTKENLYSLNQQVKLSVIIDFLNQQGFKKIKELPWGSPVYEGLWQGQKIQIVAYTEPSVGWERLHGIARSWNLMADGKCYASLEDSNSLLENL